jgi:Histidine kinase
MTGPGASQGIDCSASALLTPPASLIAQPACTRHGSVCNGSSENLDQEDIMREFASQAPFREERVLLHELNHRINNEFASAISIVSRAAAASGNDEVKLALASITELLHHYADVHHALQMTEDDPRIDAAAYLRNLCLSISRSKLDHMKINLVLLSGWQRLNRMVVLATFRFGCVCFATCSGNPTAAGGSLTAPTSKYAAA